MARITAYLELGSNRVFAAALDWPGWARSGKTDQEALDRLADYAEHYRPVAERAEVRFPVAYDFDVLERLPGSGSTDFGAPGHCAGRSRSPHRGTGATPGRARRSIVGRSR